MDNAKQRQAILETLYSARHQHAAEVDALTNRRNGGGLMTYFKAMMFVNPGKHARGWITEFDLKGAHGDIFFALDVLLELGYIRCSGPRYQITGAGVIACEGLQ